MTDPIRRRGRPFEALIVGAAGLTALLALVWWMDNVHISTTNGMFKSLSVQSWMKDPALATLDRGNYLYFPAMAVLCRGLDLLGVHTGMPWKQLAIINAVCGAVCLAIVFSFVRAITGRRDVAMLAALFHGASAFVLTLSITNEDILPGYSFVLASMALAALWFDRPTMIRSAIVGSLFTLGWLLEWRLLFPTLPALLLALALTGLSWRKRSVHMAALALAILLTAEIAALFWDGHNGSGQILQLLWPAKGVDSGWGGFAVNKLALLAIGIGEYLLGGRNIAGWGGSFLAHPEVLVSLAFQLSLLATVLWFGWRERADMRMRVVLAVFVGTFAAGEMFNLYSQPQDPQMQINVMPWLTVAWALVLWRAAAVPRAAAAVVPLAVLAYNLAVLSPSRGQDSAEIAALGELERLSNPAGTVFLYHGFEGSIGWQNLLWSVRWSGVCDLPRAPAADPKFKWIGVTHSLIQKPERSSAQHAEALREEIECALGKGYRVLTSPIWSDSPEAFAARFVSLNGAQHAPALLKLLHDNYVLTPAFTTPSTGPYLEVRRR